MQVRFPDTIKSDWNDMVLVDCANRVSDHGCLWRGYSSYLALRSTFREWSKNVAMMEELETRLNKVIEDNKNNGFMASIEETLTPTTTQTDNGTAILSN